MAANRSYVYSVKRLSSDVNLFFTCVADAVRYALPDMTSVQYVTAHRRLKKQDIYTLPTDEDWVIVKHKVSPDPISPCQSSGSVFPKDIFGTLTCVSSSLTPRGVSVDCSALLSGTPFYRFVFMDTSGNAFWDICRTFHPLEVGTSYERWDENKKMWEFLPNPQPSGLVIVDSDLSTSAAQYELSSFQLLYLANQQ